MTRQEPGQINPAVELFSIPGGNPSRPVVIMIGLYILLILAGIILLRPQGMIHAANPANWNEAIFAAVNAATLTGFERTLSPERYASGAAQAILAALTLAGMLLSMVAGGMMVTRIARLPIDDGELVGTSALLVVLLTLAGAVALGSDRTLSEALFISLSAFGNSGLHIGRLPGMDSWQTMLVLMPLSVIGGIGVPVILDIRNRLRGTQQRLSEFTRLSLSGNACLYLLGLLLLISLWWMSMSPIERPIGLRPLFVSASVASINTRGAGFDLEPVQNWPRPVQWGAMVLMAVGWNPAGTGGGLKITALLAVAAMAVAIVRGGEAQRAGAFALAWIGFYVGMVFVAILLQLLADPSLSGERILFETISAASNVGLSMHPVQGGVRDLLLAAVMLAGRIMPLLVLLWMWHRGGRSLPVA